MAGTNGDMIGMGYSNKKIIAPALHDRDLPHHNDVFIVPASLFETKPELFALGKDGKRRDPRNRREQPKCFSHPEVRRLYKEAARKYLKAEILSLKKRNLKWLRFTISRL